MTLQHFEKKIMKKNQATQLSPLKSYLLRGEEISGTT
jgi:hypothetical protein